MVSTLQKKLAGDLIEALKAKDTALTDTLRLLLAALHNREIEKKTKTGAGELTEEEVLEVLGKEGKKRKEAAELYEKGQRPELAKKELAELALIRRYLPEELSEADVLKAVEAAIAAIKPTGPKDLGRVMGEAMKALKGRAEAGNVSRLVKERLEKISGS